MPETTPDISNPRAASADQKTAAMEEEEEEEETTWKITNLLTI